MKYIFIFFSLSLPLLFAKPIVVVSILPQQYVVDKIAGDTLEVLVMAGAGTNHETYEPKPNQMKILSKADIYFFIGLPFEKSYLKRFKSAAPAIKMLDMGFGIDKMSFEHSHDHGKKEANDELDPHIWLDPQLLKIQSYNVFTALINQYPNNLDLYKKNYEAFVSELETIDIQIKNRLNRLGNRSFLVFHPSFGYFAERYELEQIFVEFEGRDPRAKELIDVVKNVNRKKIKFIFIEPQVSLKNASTVSKEAGIELVKIDSAQKDIFLTLEEITEMLLKFDNVKD